MKFEKYMNPKGRCNYITLRHVNATIIAVEKQKLLPFVKF